MNRKIATVTRDSRKEEKKGCLKTVVRGQCHQRIMSGRGENKDMTCVPV